MFLKSDFSPNHLKCLLTFFGLLLIFSAHGLNYCWGYHNLNIYYTSYLRNRCDQRIRYSDTIWVKTINPLGQGLGAVLGGILHRHIKAKKVISLGCIIYNLGIFLSYFTIQYNLPTFIFSYGFLFGLGANIVYGVILQNMTQWMTKYRGIFIGIGSSGYALSGIMFNKLIVYYVNPKNKKPLDYDKKNPDEKYFDDDELLDKIPKLILIMGVVFAAIQICGILCTMNAPECASNRTEDNRKKSVKKQLGKMKNFWSAYKYRRNFFLFPLIMCFHLFAYYVFMSIYKNFAFKFVPDDNFLGTVATIGAVGNFLRFIPVSFYDQLKFKTNALLNLTCAIVISCLMPVTPLLWKWVYAMFIFTFYLFMSALYPIGFLGVCEFFGVENGSFMFGIFSATLVTVMPILTVATKPLFNYSYEILFLYVSSLLIISFIATLFLKAPSFQSEKETDNMETSQHQFLNDQKIISWNES
ncbi:hypothetical protein SNEBB_008788 [Seison nebaliae]|nr:hypothetical protein SNEBB_008788 [Seison nebaliae]